MIELNEKQEQLKMLLKWRSGLLKIEQSELNAAIDSWSKLTGYNLNDCGVNILKKSLKSFGLLSVLNAIDISYKYLEYKDGIITKESVEIAFNKIKGICYINSLSDDEKEKYKAIYGLKMKMRDKYYNLNEKWMAIKISQFIKAGYSIELLRNIIDECDSYREWNDEISTYL